MIIFFYFSAYFIALLNQKNKCYWPNRFVFGPNLKSSGSGKKKQTQTRVVVLPLSLSPKLAGKLPPISVLIPKPSYAFVSPLILSPSPQGLCRSRSSERFQWPNCLPSRQKPPMANMLVNKNMLISHIIAHIWMAAF